MKKLGLSLLSIIICLVITMTALSCIALTASASLYYSNYWAIPLDSYQTFRDHVLGKAYNTDGAHGAQCWDGADIIWRRLYSILATGNETALGCWDLRREENAGTDFYLIENIYEVQRGDIVVFSTYPYGHIAFADENYSGSASIAVLGQNQGDNRTAVGDSDGCFESAFCIDWFPVSAFRGAFRYKGWVSNTPPAAPSLYIPNTYIYDNNDITISWNPVSGASYYQYYLTEYPEGYAYTTNARTGITYDSYLVFKGSELKNGRYSLFVHACNSAGQSPQSNWVSFDVYAYDYVPVKTTEYNGHIYALYDCEMSWSFARDLCKNMGGHLITVADQAEETFLEGLIGYGKKGAYWLGGTNFVTSAVDENNPYKWVTDEEFRYTNWASGEPSFSGERGTRERFIEINKNLGKKWNDACNTNKSGKGFVLEIEPQSNEITAVESFGDSTYYVIDRNTTWTEAKHYCEMMGGHLLIINNSDEEAFIDQLIEEGERKWYYVGASRRSGHWMWVNDTTTGEINWNGDLWGEACNYLMKYKGSKKYINLPNTYYPAHDICKIGFICEVEHSHEYKSVVTSPTCTEQGYTTHVCECGDSYVDSYVSALGHNFGDWFVETPATETTEGLEVRICLKCGEREERVIPPLEHVHNYTSIVTVPTCISRGYTTHTCSGCGDSYVDTYTAALGHNFGDWVVTTVATTIAEGVETRTCSRCGATETRAIPKLDPLEDPDMPKLVISKIEKATPGKTVTVNVSVENNPGFSSFIATINYDTSRLTLDSVALADGIGGQFNVARNVAWINSSDFTGDGVFMTLMFTVKEDAEEGDAFVTIAYEEGDISNHNEADVNFAAVDGYVHVIRYVPGDINGDGKVNSKDLTRLLKYVSGEDVEVNEAALDVNGDGKVNSKDLTRLLKYVSGEDVEIF